MCGGSLDGWNNGGYADVLFFWKLVLFSGVGMGLSDEYYLCQVSEMSVG